MCFPDSCGPTEAGGGSSQLFCLWNALQVGGGLGLPRCQKHTPEAARVAHLELRWGEPGQSSRVRPRSRCSLVRSYSGHRALRPCRVKSESCLYSWSICLSTLSWKPSPALLPLLLPAPSPPPCPSSTVHSTLTRHHFFLVLEKNKTPQ